MINKVTLKIDDKNAEDDKYLKVARMSDMINERFCFGNCTTNEGRYIVAVGGALSSYNHTS